MLPTVAVETTDDEARWADAESLLDDAPTESAQLRLRRRERYEMLIVIGAVVLGLAVFIGLGVVFHGSFGEQPAHVPVWQEVTGLVLMGIGLVVLIAALVVTTRSSRRVPAWRSPLMVLTRAQRKDLLDQVRGRTPLDPRRIRLARLLALRQVVQGKALLTSLGLGIGFLGQWVLEPTGYRAALAVFLLLLLAVFGPLRTGRSRVARRFLAEHPADA